MHRRTVIHSLVALAALPLLPACSRAAPGTGALATGAAAGAAGVSMLDHPDAYWRDKVSAAAYAVLFNEDTEPPGSSPLDDEKREGTFICAACHLPLFDSTEKFDSGKADEQPALLAVGCRRVTQCALKKRTKNVTNTASGDTGTNCCQTGTDHLCCILIHDKLPWKIRC